MAELTADLRINLWCGANAELADEAFYAAEPVQNCSAAERWKQLKRRVMVLVALRNVQLTGRRP